MLHVFDAACNLIDAASGVVSLVTPQIGDGPFSIVVPGVKFSDYVKHADQVICSPNVLIVGSLEIDVTAAPLWHPCPPWGALHAQREQLRGYLPLLAGALHEMAPAGSLAGLVVDLPTPISAIEASTLRAARAPVDELTRGLLQGDRSLCLEGVGGLAGLGGGLTPSGDDWLIGCMLAARIILPKPQAEAVALPVANAAARRTTALSAAWLRAAARGECAAPWHSLFDSLLSDSDNEAVVYEAAREIIRQGHTSGADALAGFVASIYSPGALPQTPQGA